jgi:hypothetical protein
MFRRHNCAARRTRSCRKKNRANSVAFGLPQDSSLQLMLEACVNRGSELSGLRGVGFHIERRVADPVRRPRMRGNRLNARSNFHVFAGNCSRYAFKRFHLHGFP